MMWKKAIAPAAILGLALGMTACSNSDDNTPEPSASNTAQATQSADATEPATTTATAALPADGAEAAKVLLNNVYYVADVEPARGQAAIVLSGHAANAEAYDPDWSAILPTDSPTVDVSDLYSGGAIVERHLNALVGRTVVDGVETWSLLEAASGDADYTVTASPSAGYNDFEYDASGWATAAGATHERYWEWLTEHDQAALANDEEVWLGIDQVLADFAAGNWVISDEPWTVSTVTSDPVLSFTDPTYGKTIAIVPVEREYPFLASHSNTFNPYDMDFFVNGHVVDQDGSNVALGHVDLQHYEASSGPGLIHAVGSQVTISAQAMGLDSLCLLQDPDGKWAGSVTITAGSRPTIGNKFYYAKTDVTAKAVPGELGADGCSVIEWTGELITRDARDMMMGSYNVGEVTVQHLRDLMMGGVSDDSHLVVYYLDGETPDEPNIVQTVDKGLTVLEGNTWIQAWDIMILAEGSTYQIDAPGGNMSIQGVFTNNGTVEVYGIMEISTYNIEDPIVTNNGTIHVHEGGTLRIQGTMDTTAGEIVVDAGGTLQLHLSSDGSDHSEVLGQENVSGAGTISYDPIAAW
jgi:hypothetical protein